MSFFLCESVSLPNCHVGSPENWDKARFTGWGRGAGGTYQQVHHVGLVVPQRLHRVEDVHRPLVPQHLAHDAEGAEGAAAPAPVPARRGVQTVGLCLSLYCTWPAAPRPGARHWGQSLSWSGWSAWASVPALGFTWPKTRSGTSCPLSFTPALDYVNLIQHLINFIKRSRLGKFSVNKHLI